MISVIIPYYNNSKTIMRCINSVIRQSYNCIEILLINDCSPDWEEVSQNINLKNINNLYIFHHKKNLNGSAARNTGILNAKGDFIAFLDADDEWEQNHLQNCISLYSNLGNYDFLIFSSINILYGNNDKKVITPILNFQKIKNASEYLFIDKKPISCVTLFSKSSLFKRFMFNESLRRYQDVELILRLNYFNIPIYQSPHIAATVHWEKDTFKSIVNKGANSKFVEDFYKTYNYYFTNKAKKFFLNSQLLPKLVYEKEYKTFYKFLIIEKTYQYLNIKDIIRIIYYTLRPFLKFNSN